LVFGSVDVSEGLMYITATIATRRTQGTTAIFIHVEPAILLRGPSEAATEERVKRD
jgi:hypothetical protein